MRDGGRPRPPLMLRRDLRERVRAVPGMERLLPLLVGLPPAYLVGGAVRDLLRDERVVDLDLAVEGDAVGGGRRSWPAARRPRGRGTSASAPPPSPPPTA